MRGEQERRCAVAFRCTVCGALGQIKALGLRWYSQLHKRTWSILRTGLAMIGPLPLTTSNSMPRAGRGVRMSEKKITPSGLKARQGCIDSSIAMSGVSERIRKGYLSENLRGTAAEGRRVRHLCSSPPSWLAALLGAPAGCLLTF